MSRKNRNARSVIHTHRNFSRNLISQPVQGQLTMNEVPIPATGKIACDAKCSYEYMRLPAAWLMTDTSYQRAIDEKAVERIVENFDPRLVNVIKVSHRDGRFYVFDGAHTLNALKRINGMNSFLVDCKVYRGLAYEDEAYLFALQTGESRDVAFSTRLRALLISNSQEAVDFRESTQRAGLQLASGNSTASQDTIAALAKAYKLYTRLGTQQYEAVLSLIRETWGGAAWSLTSYVLGGVAELLTEYGEEVSPERFRKKLVCVGYEDIRNEAKRQMRGSSDVAHALALVKFYNRGGGRGSLDARVLTMKD